jgi:hypothetical protein
MRNFLDKRRRRKLYDQWVTTSGLPSEEIPPDLREPESINEDVEPDEGTQSIRYRSSAYLPVKWQHVIYISLIIIVLVVVTSILATILAMQSC